MGCNCDNKNKTNFPPSVLQVNSVECPVLFHKAVIPTNFGDETETPVLMGKYKNAIVYYEANGHAYLYSSDGVPTRLDRGGANVLYVDTLPEVNKAVEGVLYVSSTGELAVYSGGDKKILNTKPTYYTELGDNADGAMTQKAVAEAIRAIESKVNNRLAEFKNDHIDPAVARVENKATEMERFVTTKIEDMKRETSTLVNTTTNDVNLMKNSLNDHIAQANIAKNDLLDKIKRNTDSINDTKNSLRNYALIPNVDNRISETKTELNEKISQAETRLNNTIGQAKTELNGKITEANGKISALDTRLTKQASDNKADITQLKANLNTTNSALLTHKEQSDKKFNDIKVEQSDQDTLISDILNAFSAESEKDTNLKLNSSATRVLGMTIYGNTEQNKYTGKNIINHLTFTTLYGSRTDTGTGVIIKRGNIDKPSIGVYSLGQAADRRMWNNIVAQTDVVLSFSVRSLTNQKLNFVYRLEPLPYNNLQLTTSWQKVVYKVQKSNANNFAAFIFYTSNLDMTDPNCGFEIKDVQIEAGTEATDYEPFIGSTLPNGYSNLCDEFSNLPLSRDGITLSNQNGVLKLTGQPTADWIPLTSRNITSLLQDKQTYTVFQPNIYGVKLYPEVIAQRKDGGKSMSWSGQNAKTFTFTVDFDTYSSYSMKLQMGPKNAYTEPITFYNNYALFIGNYTTDNLPEYSPYNTPLTSPRPQYPQVVKELSGGKVMVLSKNLLKIVNIAPSQSQTAISATFNQDNSITVQGENKNNWGMNFTDDSACPRIEQGTKVTMSIDRPLPYKLVLSCWTSTGGPSFQFPLAIINAGSTSVTNVAQYTALSGHLLFSLSEIGKQINETFKVQLEYGDTATPFVLHESSEFTIPTGLNLYKLTDAIYDEVKLENGVVKLIKRVGKLELSGDENNIGLYRTRADGSLGFQWRSPSGDFLFTHQQELATIVSSHFSILREPSAIGNNDFSSGIGLFKSGNDPYPRYTNNITIWLSFIDMQRLGITDINTFKNWLKAEKAKGTPVTIYYEMKTTTEEEITGQALLTELKKLMEMRTYKDVTNISITSTGVMPEIKVKYMRKIGG